MYARLEWKVRKRLTHLQRQLDRYCSEHAAQLTKDGRTHAAVFTMEQASHAAHALGLAHRWRSLTAMINGHTLRGPLPMRIVWLVHCFADMPPHDDSYCCDYRDWLPSHQNSLFPCRMVYFVPNDKRNLYAPWCDNCAERTTLDQWTLDKMAVLEEVNRQIAHQHLYLCPAFSQDTVRAWLNALPERVETVEDGWIGALEDVNRALHDVCPGASFGIRLANLKITVRQMRRLMGKPGP